MSGTSSHEEHLVRHFQRVKRSFDHTRVKAVLDAAGLREAAAGLVGADGVAVGPMQCASYLEAVRRVLGDAEYYPARVNFILARCSSVTASAPDPGIRSPT